MKLRTQDGQTKRLFKMAKVSHKKISWRLPPTQVDNDDEWSTPRVPRVTPSVVVCPASQGVSLGVRQVRSPRKG